jgi:calpain-15
MKFFKNNRWVTVIIDDYLPCNEHGKPVYARCLNPNEFWVPLVEKAYAKLHTCYQSIETGSESAAFLDLTGFPPEERRLKEDLKSANEVFDWISKNVVAGHLLGTSRIELGGKDAMGILVNHAYGILDAQEIEGWKLIKLRNP